jgi:creatinine amidohydrolase
VNGAAVDDASADDASVDRGHTASRQLLARRIAQLPTALARCFDVPLQARRPLPRVAITGAGGSEGPARLLQWQLSSQTEVAARFVPLSAFAPGAPSPAARDEQLVVFSQGLSDNARLALARHRDFAAATLFTSTAPDDAAAPGSAAAVVAEAQRDGTEVVHHPPDDEAGLLLRVVGPAAAALAAWRWSSRRWSKRPDAPPALEPLLEAHARGAGMAERLPTLLGVTALDRPTPIALVSFGVDRDAYHGLRWKLLEGLGVPDPPVWDVLQVAHGPFQQFYGQPLLLCALHDPRRPHHRELLARLDDMLVHSRHQLVPLASHSDGSYAWFEHDAQVNALLLHQLARCPRDLVAWPGKGEDASLYGFGPRPA